MQSGVLDEKIKSGLLPSKTGLRTVKNGKADALQIVIAGSEKNHFLLLFHRLQKRPPFLETRYPVILCGLASCTSNQCTKGRFYPLYCSASKCDCRNRNNWPSAVPHSQGKAVSRQPCIALLKGNYCRKWSIWNLPWAAVLLPAIVQA